MSSDAWIDEYRDYVADIAAKGVTGLPLVVTGPLSTWEPKPPWWRPIARRRWAKAIPHSGILHIPTP